MVPLISERLRAGQAVELTVTGQSMWPLLRDGVSVVRLSAPQTLRRGEIALFETGTGKYCLHRIRRIRKDGSLDCRGDGNSVWERNIPPEKVLAIVTDFRRDAVWTSCRSPGYRCYVLLWQFLGGLRLWYLRILRHRKKQEGTV